MRFGGLTAVSELNLNIPADGLIGLIGPNGAGKTTVFNIITGVYQPTEGDILVDGKSIVGDKPYQICHQGIARTFQNIRICKSLTVFETVQMALIKNLDYGFGQAAFSIGKYNSEEKRVRNKIMELLEIFNLVDGLAKMAKDKEEDKTIHLGWHEETNMRLGSLEKIHPQGQHISS